MINFSRLNSLRIVFFYFILFSSVCRSQNAFQESIKIGIIPFKNLSRLENAEQVVVKFQTALREALNRNKNFSAEILPDSILIEASLLATGTNDLEGFISVDLLTKIKKLKLAEWDFFLECEISTTGDNNDGIESNCCILDYSSLKEKFTIQVEPSPEELFKNPDNFANMLVQKTLDALIIKLTQPIRIAVLNFEMTGGDSSEFILFEKSLPNMLTTDLGVSPNITLIEISKIDTLLNTILRSEVASGIYSQATAIEIGHLLHSNYLIMGAYWERKNQLRIDVRCVNIKTRQSTIMKKINIDEISTNNVSQKIEKLASDIRFAIEHDLMNLSKLASSIAFTGYPPIPYDNDTHTILLNLIKTATKKLKVIHGIEVKDNPDKIKEFLSNRHDRWEMCFELDSDILLTFQIDRLNPENVIIGWDLFDSRTPDRVLQDSTVTIPKSRLNESIDSLVNSICIKIIEMLVIEKDSIKTNDSVLWNQINKIEYFGLYHKYGIAFRVGFIVRNDRNLFLSQGLGLSLELSFLYLPFPSSKFQFEPLTFTIGILNSTPDKSVTSLDYFVIAKYKTAPFSTWNFFYGAGIGILGALFIAPEDRVFDANLGFALLTGIEPYIGNSWHMNFEFKWTIGISKLEPRDIRGTKFAGGTLGGLQFSIGLGYNW